MPLPPNLQQMLQQAQQMQEEMMKTQEALKDERVDASAGGGMVRVVATGDGRLESIEIDRDAVDPDRKSTRLNSSHANISYAVFCLKKKNHHHPDLAPPSI